MVITNKLKIRDLGKRRYFDYTQILILFWFLDRHTWIYRSEVSSIHHGLTWMITDLCDL